MLTGKTDEDVRRGVSGKRGNQVSQATLLASEISLFLTKTTRRKGTRTVESHFLAQKIHSFHEILDHSLSK